MPQGLKESFKTIERNVLNIGWESGIPVLFREQTQKEIAGHFPAIGG